MTTSLQTAEIYSMLTAEGTRTKYPDNLPAIPPLPAQRYSDLEFYRLEIEHVFKKSWIAAGHISELPEPGAYKLFEELDLSIIISRGIDNKIRAFRNACRHRAAAIVTETTGIARRFVCPYHAWAYSTEGDLKSVPEQQNFACLKKEDLGLRMVRCEIWRGFIFINLDEGAEDLATFMAPISAQVEDFPLETMVAKRVVVIDLQCNWKTAYDNFLESYHINVVHRKTIAPYINTKTWTAQLLANGHGCLRTFKRNSESLFRSEGVASDGKVSDKTGIAKVFKDVTFAIPHFPNGTAGLDPTGFNWQSFWPTGPDTCRMVNLFMGAPAEDEEADRKFWDDFITYNNAILAEDAFLFPSMQRSIRSGDITEVWLSTQEQYIQWYHEHIDQAIGTDKVRPELRVRQVLSSHLS